MTLRGPSSLPAWSPKRPTEGHTAGMPEPQAEILAEEQARKVCEQLTTKHDMTLTLLRSDLDRLKDQLTVRLGVMLRPPSRSSLLCSSYSERWERLVST